MADHYGWRAQGAIGDYHLPPRPFLYRVPVIKRFKYAYDMWKLDRWYSAVPGIRTGYDEWCLYGWWYGLTMEDCHGE
ncbi:hypothetical protein [Ochrobactrum sp. CGA5]|uniref:hypothetical protein n=1 Tax=Ochrobactrum sp. CGA5 TaxID=2583453 RepID=UPI001121DCAD|nr:hypothetical protein [Ochrobactrum sp. CGA5]